MTTSATSFAYLWNSSPSLGGARGGHETKSNFIRLLDFPKGPLPSPLPRRGYPIA